jgi:PKD repeat protein
MRNIFSIILTSLVLLMVHGCSDNDFPVPPASTVSKFSTTITNDAFAPATVAFKSESIIPERAGSVTYQWSFGDGTSSTEQNPTHDYASPGAYAVTLVLVTEKSLEIVASSTTLVIKDPNATGVPFYFWTNGVQTMLLNDQPPLAAAVLTPGVTSSYGMAIDTVADRLYIGNDAAAKIYVCGLDGSGLAEFRTSAGTVAGLAIDYKTSRLYWVTEEGDVKWADMTNSSTSQMETLVTGQDNSPQGVGIDPVSRRLFWNKYDGGVWSIDLDAGGAVAAQIAANPGGGGSMIVVDGRLYYDEYTATNDVKIVSTNLQGQDRKEIITGISRLVYAGIAYSKDQNKLYWSDRNTNLIKRANLDGSGVETFYTSTTGYPRAFAIGKKR